MAVLAAAIATPTIARAGCGVDCFGSARLSLDPVLVSDLDAAGYLIYDSSGPLYIGTDSGVTHGLTTGDVIVGDESWFEGIANFGSQSIFYSPVTLYDTSVKLGITGSTASWIVTSSTTDELTLSLGSDHQNALVIGIRANRDKDYDVASTTHPQLILASETDPDIDNTQKMHLYHDTTAGVVSTETGHVVLNPATGGVRIGRIVAASVAEPATCDATSEGVIVYVNDNDDSAGAQMCICATITDDSTYDWRDAGDIAGTACSFF
jgi:hypothetical protein